MFSFLNRRAFVLLIGFVLIAIFIWYAGPYFAFANYRPLETETARLYAIGLLILCWLASALIRWLRAARMSDRLASAVLRPSPQEKERPSAESSKLRERFEEAVAGLKQQRRDGHSLYDLPWYVFIGAPGSGKTTALLNSGLRFPLEHRVGKGAVRGVGGTRNCDWWFTDEAVFLDTAGRYTTQDSDAASDSEGWKVFLSLLSTYRKRRPLNGIVLTISVHDLMTQGEADREAHVEAARRRLNELTTELRIQLPVYLMVTKCDMVPGFTEYFDDLSQEGWAQVWGVTFPYEQTLDGDAPDGFAAEFSALMARLNERLFARLEEERNGRRRAAVFAFPQHMAAMRDLLTQFVGDVFTPSRLDPQILLRGVYFTSGTQDGTQIDRLLGAIGRRFGVAPDAVAPPAGRGKAYFVERLLKHVIIGESGLAGVNRRLEVQQAVRLIGAAAATALVVVVGLVAFSVSYARNRDYVGQVATDVAALRQVRPAATTASLEAFLPYLNFVRALSDSANRHREDIPWGMRWGLYQGGSIGNAARDAYQRELDSIVLPRFAARLKQALTRYASEPEKLYGYLKGYLMLGDPHHFDRKYLQSLADLEWSPGTAGGARPSPSTHVRTLLENSDTLRPMALDPSIVAQARSTLRQASIPRIMYQQLQRSYSEGGGDPLRLDIIAGMGIEKVFKRKSGLRLSDPISPFYTQRVFKEVTGAGMAVLVKQYADDEWVWGSGAVSVTTWPRLMAQVVDLYERDYNNIWDGILADIDVVPFSTVQQYADALGVVVGPTSPLRGILRTAVENTSLIAASTEAGATSATAPSIGTRITEKAKDIFNTAQKRITGTASIAPGTVITQHFKPIHLLMAGAPAPIDGVLEQIGKIRDQLGKVGPQVGGEQPLQALADPAVLNLISELKRDAANLPAPVNALVAQFAANAGRTLSGGATKDLEQQYQEQVVTQCRVRVEGRFPFGNGADMALADFAVVFGYGGLYDKFFADNIDKLVNRSQRPWTWREDSVHPSADMLPQFERADRIRRMFFSPGAKLPELNFYVGLSRLDSAAERFYLYLDGRRFEVRPGGESRSPGVWPGSDKGGSAYGTFEDRVAAPEQAKGFDGPWALFRLIDATTLPHVQGQPETELKSVLRFQTKFHQAQVTIEAPNAVSNPFAANEWRHFRCEP